MFSSAFPLSDRASQSHSRIYSTILLAARRTALSYTLNTVTSSPLQLLARGEPHDDTCRDRAMISRYRLPRGASLGSGQECSCNICIILSDSRSPGLVHRDETPASFILFNLDTRILRSQSRYSPAKIPREFRARLSMRCKTTEEKSGVSNVRKILILHNNNCKMLLTINGKKLFDKSTVECDFFISSHRGVVGMVFEPCVRPDCTARTGFTLRKKI